LNKKVLYYFSKFAIVNELLIIEDYRNSTRDRTATARPRGAPHRPELSDTRHCV